MNQQSYVHIRLRRDSAANWTENNPVLKVGEPGLETDTRKLKFGDGITPWKDLQYSGIDINDNVVLENIDDRVAGLIKGGSNILVSYNDDSNELTISATGLQLVGDYATLVNGRVPASLLPSYVDDVLEFDNLITFPSEGETDKIYIALDSNKVYRWSGSSYVEISASPGSTDAVPEGSVNKYYTDARASAASPVQSVAGRTGVVTLGKSDVGLSNVDNTSDADKPVSTAQASADSAVQTAAAADATTKANAAQAYSIQRSNHTGTQSISTVDGLQSALDGKQPAGNYASDTHNHTINDVSELQTSLDNKAPIANPTFTGTVGGITKSMVGLANVDNTSDADKPVSTAQASADTAVQNAAASDATTKANAVQAYSIQRSNHTGTQSISTVDGLQSALDGKSATSHTHDDRYYTESEVDNLLAAKQATGNYATLVNGTVPASQLPSYVDDVVEVANLAALSGLVADSSFGAAAGTYSQAGTYANSPYYAGQNSDGTSNGWLMYYDADMFGWILAQTNTPGVDSSNGYSANGDPNKAPLKGWFSDTSNGLTLTATSGEVGKIYVTLDSNKTYRWSGSSYVEISASPGSTDAVPEGSTNKYYTDARASAAAPVQSVAGRTGVVTLGKSDVGLGNVDNTSDANKPVSTAQQSALDLKAPIANPTFTGTVNGITKSMVGLSNVDNTSDADKPVSTAQASADTAVQNAAASDATTKANAAQAFAIQRSNHTGTQAISTISGLQSSLDGKSNTSHTHTSSQITDFSSAVSGLLPTISNSGDNRLLTSTGTSTGINAESNITFDGSGLNMVSSSGFILSSLGTPPNENLQIPGQLPPPYSEPATRITLLQENWSTGPNLEIRYAGPIPDQGNSGTPRLILAKSKGSYISPEPLDANQIIASIRMDTSPALVENQPNSGYYTRAANRILGVTDGVIGGNNLYQPSRLQLEVSSGPGNLDKNLTIWSDGKISTNCSLYVYEGAFLPTPIADLGVVSGNTAISVGVDRLIQKLTLNGTSVNITEGAGWDVADRSIDIMLEITVSSNTTVAFDSNFITDWYSSLPSFVAGSKHLILLRSMGIGVVQGHYISSKI